jgi:hypothetical protein
VTANQQPRQILFSLRSIVLFSSAIAESGFVCGPVASVGPPGADRAEPVVTPAPLFAAPEPDDWAVPALLVPGAVGSLAALPAPLGSLTELFRPPGLAGPGGTPLTAAVPAPAEPALGEPAAPPLPAVAPLAAPPALPPPLLCANETAGIVRIAIAAIAALTDVLVIGNSFVI